MFHNEAGINTGIINWKCFSEITELQYRHLRKALLSQMCMSLHFSLTGNAQIFSMSTITQNQKLTVLLDQRKGQILDT